MRSSTLYPLSSPVVATLSGMYGDFWRHMPSHWTVTFSMPIAVVIAITALSMTIRSKRLLRSLLVGLCILGAMFADAVWLDLRALLPGVLLAQVGLFAAASLPWAVWPEKGVLWILGTFVPSVWVLDFVSVGRHISFFGPTMIQ